MRIAFIGAGGVGGYFGGRLAHAGLDVTFLARGATLEALRTRGLRVDSIAGDFVVPSVHATDDPSSVGVVDAIVVTVKAWQIAEAARQLGPMIGPQTVIVPLENGIDAHDQLAAAAGREHVLAGLCGIVSFIVEPGHVRHIGAEPFVMFGELDNSRSERTERLRDAFLSANVKADIPPDIHRSLWTKLIFVAPYGAVGALTRAPIGVWRTTPETRTLIVKAVEEYIAVANARGVTLDENIVPMTLQRYDGLAAESTTSLQRDIIEGKPSELEAQIGVVVRMARESGVAAPVCETMYALLKAHRAT